MTSERKDARPLAKASRSTSLKVFTFSGSVDGSDLFGAANASGVLSKNYKETSFIAIASMATITREVTNLWCGTRAVDKAVGGTDSKTVNPGPETNTDSASDALMDGIEERGQEREQGRGVNGNVSEPESIIDLAWECISSDDCDTEMEDVASNGHMADLNASFDHSMLLVDEEDSEVYFNDLDFEADDYFFECNPDVPALIPINLA